MTWWRSEGGPTMSWQGEGALAWWWRGEGGRERTEGREREGLMRGGLNKKEFG